MNNQFKIGKRESLFLFITAFLFIAANIILTINQFELLPLTPLLIVYLLILINNYSLLFFIGIASLPFSFEIPIGGLTLSVPSEPIMISLLFVCVALLLKGNQFDRKFYKHPLVFILFLHYLTFIVNIFFSIEPILSLKYLLSKTWYIAAFLIFPSIILDSEKQIKKTFWFIFIPLLITVIYTVIRHSLTGFDFDMIKASGQPFYSDHVIYSCTIAFLLPFVWFSVHWFKNNKKHLFWISIAILILLFAIATSYTRTTWIAVVLCLPAYLVFKSKLFKKGLLAACIGVIAFCFYIAKDNRFVEYAPNYQKTVFNKGNLEKHLEATYTMEDVSGMERVYRWVAAVNMIKSNFYFGTGNNTFYPEYKKYVNPIFVTFISHNPEHSSTHNYFLMIFSEQGVFGFSLFVILYISMLLYCYKINKEAQTTFIRRLSAACYLALFTFLIHLTLGDMMEVDKLGPIFFLILALLVRMDNWNTELKEDSNKSTH